VARNLLRNSAKKTATLKIVGKIESCQLPVNLNQELSGTVAQPTTLNHKLGDLYPNGGKLQA
jgi:hypothetical protein